MKTFILFILLCIFMGCKDSHVDYTVMEDFIVNFNITDINGNTKSIFKTEERFNIDFSIQNKSGKEIIFEGTDPISELLIYYGDSLIINHYGSLLFTKIVKKFSINNGSIIGELWKNAPTPLSGEQIILRPGIYKAKVKYSFGLRETQIPTIDPITFEIVK